MNEENKGKEEAPKEEADTSSDSPTEENKPEESEDSSEGKKILDSDPLSDQQAEWDNQPSVASLEASENQNESKEETESKEITGLEKERERVKAKRDEILEDIKKTRGEIREAKKDNPEVSLEEPSEPIESEPVETKTNDMEQYVDNRIVNESVKKDFHEAHPDFYRGDDGIQNQQVVEDYIATHFAPLPNTSAKTLRQQREMVHKEIFGEFEKDNIARKAKSEANKESLMNELATTGSSKGGTSLNVVTTTRKRIIPKEQEPEQWY